MQDTYIGQETVSLGVIVEKRRSSHPWQDETCEVTAVVPHMGSEPQMSAWSEIVADGNRVQYYAGCLPLSLFRTETQGYVTNLTQVPPRIFVVMRSDSSGQAPIDFVPFHITACPFEGQIYLDNGEDQVDAVAMPEMVRLWVQDFVQRHHVDEPFKKRHRGSKLSAEPKRAPFEPPADSPPRREGGE